MSGAKGSSRGRARLNKEYFPARPRAARGGADGVAEAVTAPSSAIRRAEVGPMPGRRGTDVRGGRAGSPARRVRWARAPSRIPRRKPLSSVSHPGEEPPVPPIRRFTGRAPELFAVTAAEPGESAARTASSQVGAAGRAVGKARGRPVAGMPSRRARARRPPAARPRAASPGGVPPAPGQRPVRPGIDFAHHHIPGRLEKPSVRAVKSSGPDLHPTSRHQYPG